MRRFIVACFLFAATLTFGQGKELTLNDAVMEQYRGFYPTHTFGVQWIPGEDAYSMIEQYSTLVKVDAKSGKKTVLASLESIKTETGLKLNYLTAYEWKGNNTIFFQTDSNLLITTSLKNRWCICNDRRGKCLESYGF
jgi:hypothetical protein